MAQPTMRIATDADKKSLPRRVNFTLKTLQSLSVPAGADRVWIYDTRTPHLAYMLTRAGAGSFYWCGRVNGRPQRYRLGDGTLSLEQVRKLAANVEKKVSDGADPQAEKSKARAEMRFSELFEWYLENHAKPRKRTWKEDQSQYRRHLKALGSRRFTSITRLDISKLHNQIGANSPFAANRVLSLVKCVFNKATLLGYDGPNPCKGIAKFPEQQRERFLQADELPRFFKALNRMDTAWRDFFNLSLLTGARRGNLMKMEWPEINFDRATWTISPEKFKTNKPMTIPLVPEAVEILRCRYTERVAPPAGQPDYVFKGYGKTGHITETKMAWSRLCKAANLSDIRLHDLRRTLGSWQAATGASLPVIGKSLGHTQQQTTQIYARLNIDPVRQSVGKAVDAMMQIKDGGDDAAKR